MAQTRHMRRIRRIYTDYPATYPQRLRIMQRIEFIQQYSQS